MDLLKAWVIGAVAWVIVSLVVATAITSLATDAVLSSVGGQLLVDYLPALVSAGCVAAAAALLHPTPQRAYTARHAVAALTVPALSIIANAVLLVVNGPAAAGPIVGNIVAGILGAVTGWRLADRAYISLQRRDARR